MALEPNRSAGVSSVPPTLAHLLGIRARRQPEQTAYVFLRDGEHERDEFTYAELDLAARKWAASMAEVARPGDRVLLLLPPGLELIAAFYGALYGRFVPVPAYPPRGDRQVTKLRAVAADAHPSVVVAEPGAHASAISHLKREAPLAVLSPDEVKATSRPLPTMDQMAEGERPRPEATALLQYTSGATGDPRGVILSHANLMHNSELIARCFEHTADSRGLVWLPPYHDMGLIGGILQPLYVGFPVVLLSPMHVLQQPVRWLRAMSEWRTTTSGGPDFAFELCVERIGAEQRRQLDLSHWDVAFTGAEPVRARTLERFAGAFSECGFRPKAWLPCYGLAEATLIVSGSAKSTLPKVLHCSSPELERGRAVIDPQGPAVVGCGRAREGQHLLIVDPRTRRACPDGRIGEIWVTGPSVAAGYWNRPGETDATFAARLAGAVACATQAEEPPTASEQYPPSPRTTFLRTGDLGFLRDGELFVTGRLKELIVIAGRNHYPQDLERTVEGAHPVIQARGCIVFDVFREHDEVLIAVAEVQRRERLQLRRETREQEAVLRAVRGAVAHEHGLQIFDLLLVRPASLPRTSSGKLRRNLCREHYLNDALQVL